MLAIFALSLLIFTQTTLADSSDGEWLDLRDQSPLLDAAKKTTRNTPDDEPQCSPADLGLIIDASRSIYEPDFTTGLEFLAEFLDEFDIGTGSDQDRVAAVTFGRGVYTMDGFNLDTYDNKEDVKAHLLNMPFRAGSTTETAKALRTMREWQMMLKRSNARQIQLVLTDGDSVRPVETKRQADFTHELNIKVVSVGVGTKVKREELVNIAGGVKENAHNATTYDDLDKALIEKIIKRLCKPCGVKYPADINFVFSAATMGLTQTKTVTSFINKVIKHKDLKEGVQFGVVSGDCPADAGFNLNRYNSVGDISAHLERYDRNNLPNIVQRASDIGFTTTSGARSDASQKAVIFLTREKVNTTELVGAINRMVTLGIQVFVSPPYKRPPKKFVRLMSDKVTFLVGDTAGKVTQLLTALCRKAKTSK